MHIILNIRMDTHNSDPTEKLEIRNGIANLVYLKISDIDREIGIDKDELKKALDILL